MKPQLWALCGTQWQPQKQAISIVNLALDFQKASRPCFAITVSSKKRPSVGCVLFSGPLMSAGFGSNAIRRPLHDLLERSLLSILSERLLRLDLRACTLMAGLVYRFGYYLAPSSRAVGNILL